MKEGTEVHAGDRPVTFMLRDAAREEVHASATTWWRWERRGLVPPTISLGGKRFVDADRWEEMKAALVAKATGQKAAE